MEQRTANVIIAKAGGNASRNAYGCKLALPKTWLAKMGVTLDEREVMLSFDGERIVIESASSTKGVQKARFADKQEINRFARKWLELFSSPRTPEPDLAENTPFGEECFALGFTMDCGKSFEFEYPELFRSRDPDANPFANADSLRRMIDRVNDAELLGAAIFSQWRYFNHWANAPIDREWFVVAFTRLVELTA